MDRVKFVNIRRWRGDCFKWIGLFCSQSMTHWEGKATCEISRTLEEEMMGLRFALKICVHAIYSSGTLKVV
jgi:hypothetical protein